jgi:hypothetical protein
MVVGVNPVVQEVEAIAAPTVTTITLRSAWTGTGGTYSFLANQTSEGLRDAVQAIRTNNASLQSFIDSIDTAATANSVAQRTSDGSLNAVNVNATGDVNLAAGKAVKFSATSYMTPENNVSGAEISTAGVLVVKTGSTPAERLRIDSSGNVGIGTSSPNAKFEVLGGNIRSTLVGASSSTFRGFEMAVDTAVTASLQNRPSDGETRLSSGFSGFGGYTTFYTNGAERMRIDSAGNVGIGVTNPSTFDDANAGGNLVVGTGSGSEGITVFSGTGGAGVLCFADGASSTTTYEGYVQYDHDSNSMRFATSTTERMRIDSSGNVLFATTSWSAGGGGTSILGTDGRIDRSVTTTDAAVQIYFGNPNGIVGQISTSGSSTTYSTSSDYRLKEDWQPMVGNIDRLMQLKPCNFAWKVDGSRVDGFLAHEAQEIVPEAVHGTKDAMRTEQYEVSPAVYENVVIPAEFDEEGNEISPERTEHKLVKEAVMGEREVPEYQGIDQAKIVPLLTAALQDAIKKIEALEARIEALEG